MFVTFIVIITLIMLVTFIVIITLIMLLALTVLLTLIMLVTSKHTITHPQQQMYTKGLQSVRKFTNCCMFRRRGAFLRKSQTQRSTSKTTSTLEAQSQTLGYS